MGKVQKQSWLFQPDVRKANDTIRADTRRNGISKRGSLRGKVSLVMVSDIEKGKDLVIALAQRGAALIVVCPEKLHRAYLQLKIQLETMGYRCLVAAGDPTDENFAQEMMEHIIERFGRIDIFVDCWGSPPERRQASPLPFLSDLSLLRLMLEPLN